MSECSLSQDTPFLVFLDPSSLDQGLASPEDTPVAIDLAWVLGLSCNTLFQSLTVYQRGVCHEVYHRGRQRRDYYRKDLNEIKRILQTQMRL